MPVPLSHIRGLLLPGLMGPVDRQALARKAHDDRLYKKRFQMSEPDFTLEELEKAQEVLDNL